MKAVLLSVAALVAALALAEIGLRVLDIARPVDMPPRPTRPDVFIADADVGYRLWPSTRSCMRYPVGSNRLQHVVSNSDGFFSSRELGEADPRPRVLVLGDSFTFGTGVEEGARYTEVVEEIEPGWRIDNLAMPGWGVDLMVRALERFGPKARPTVVVLAVYTDDFRRLDPLYAGVGFPYTKFALADGRLVDEPFPRRTLLSRLRLVELVRIALAKRDPNHYALNEALLGQFQALASQLKASPVVLFLPGRADTEVDRERRGRLAQWTNARGIPFRDLTTLIHDAGANATFIADNWHWNERGHRIAGEALHDLLATTVLRDRRSGGAVAPSPRQSWRYCIDGSSTQKP